MHSRSVRRAFVGLLVFTITILAAFAGIAEDVRHIYDDLNRLKRTFAEDGSVVDYIYDEVGNRTQKTYYEGIPIISAAPSAIVYGTLSTGGISSSQTITVLNSGTVNLLIGTTSLTGTNAADFSTLADTCSGRSVAPNASCTLQAVFSPQTDGARSANLVIPSNDIDVPTTSILLSGTAIPSITVTAPNGGDRWALGGTYQITWAYTGNPGGNVKIQVYKNGVLESTPTSSVSKGTGGVGSYNWTIPGTYHIGNDYTIKVTSTTTAAYTDESDAVFIIELPSITVTAPNGGERRALGGTYPIAWTYTGNPGSYVKIQVYKNGVLNSTPTSSISKGTGGVGSFNWTIPGTYATGDDFTVKVTSTTTAAYTDESDAAFTIELPIITVTSPNGGERWALGGTYQITWAYTGNPGTYVKIDLYSGGVYERTIISSVSKGTGGVGSHSCTLSTTRATGVDYTIKVTSTGNAAYTDTSDAVFIIELPIITVTAPNGGEIWARSSTNKISWTYTGNPGTYVKVDLFKAGILNKTIIASVSKGTGGAGSYNWAIPATQAAGADYMIKVTSTTTATYTDTSDTMFAVQ